ncbi:MAG: adenosylcobinamide-GDP ribazoletransferase [Lachnospiraceae bacterium]|nr:adenosylcobinamide-GDP ribazoletransferase [Lachnospiraceae bacterium]
MKTAIEALVIAFSMYSKIPMPGMKWEEKGMKYAMCFFPVIGLVEGLIVYLVGSLLWKLGVSRLLFGCVMAVLPLGITGGIHMDGFLDTADAISSYGEKEKRLEILKDPHTGAFAIICGIVYMVLSVGFWNELSRELLPVAALSFCMSRALSGFAVMTFPKAKKDGLVSTFRDAAGEQTVRICMVIYAVLILVCACGVSVIGAAMMVCACAITYGYHYVNCMKRFGGITGDLAGYFLQINELVVLIALVSSQYLG